MSSIIFRLSNFILVFFGRMLYTVIVEVRTTNERIKQIRKEAGLTLEKFGERIGITASSCSTIESGKSNPSKQTILMICQEFGVSEAWLRTGAGEAYAPPSRAEEMGRLVKSLMADKPESFRSRLITALLRFDADSPEWQVLENIYNSIAAGVEKETDQ